LPLVGKIITFCEEWQVSRACFDATLLKESFLQPFQQIYTLTVHMNKHTHFIQQAEVFEGAAF